MYDPRKVVGDFFEEKLRLLLNLNRYDDRGNGSVPDLISKSNSFYMESKASAFNKGGMIKEKQLLKFNEERGIRRFYAFGYHSIVNGRLARYKDEDRLRNSLDLRSLYIFPFSIVMAYYEHSKKIRAPNNGFYIQLREQDARNIFSGKKRVWENLDLDIADYKKRNLHPKIHLITREGHLEQEILNSFNPEFL